VGRVHLLRTLVVAAIVQAIGLAATALTTYLVGVTSGVVRWAVAPSVALLVAMATALVEASTSEAPEPTTRRPRGTPAVAALLVVLLVVGVGGFVLSAGVRYGVGYVTGKESGPDRLKQPAPIRQRGALSLAVEHVWQTPHFTRVALAVRNDGSQTVDLPVFGYCVLSSKNGTTLAADAFRSQWSTTVPPGSFQRGVVTFVGHLPSSATKASLSFTQVFGPGGRGALTVRRIRLLSTDDMAISLGRQPMSSP
jgi:hypothetical protein